MREIKFRTWDTENKEFSEWTNRDPFFDTSTSKIFFWERVRNDDGSYDGDIILGDLNDRFILQQYTGLKDTEGEEIYEGDLLSRGEEYRDVEVQFRSACFWVGLLPLYQEVRHLKVVGNIHENKESTVSNSQSRR